MRQKHLNKKKVEKREKDTRNQMRIQLLNRKVTKNLKKDNPIG